MQIPDGMNSGTFTAPDGRQVTFQISSIAAAAAAPASSPEATPMDLDEDLDPETMAIHRDLEALAALNPPLKATLKDDPKLAADHAKYLAAKAKSAGSQLGRHNQRERKKPPPAHKKSSPEVARISAGLSTANDAKRTPSVEQK